jgi:hypothetical protein
MLILWIKVRQKFMQVSPLRLNSALTLNPSPKGAGTLSFPLSLWERGLGGEGDTA